MAGGPSLQPYIMAATQSSSWSDLQPELLGLILKRLPSLADRVRVRAVCWSWRKNAQLQPLPPPLPWLSLLVGTFLSFPDGEVHRMRIPDDSCYHGSVDNWLFLMQNDGGCSLMNPFAKIVLQLPKLPTIWHQEMGHPGPPVFFKFVVPSSLDMSSDSLVAVLMIDSSFQSEICICQPPFASDILRKNNYNHIYDVVFFKEKLYALFRGELVVLEIDEKHKCEPKISPIKWIFDSTDYFPTTIFEDMRYLCSTSWKYLVESAGRLLLVIRMIGILLPLPEHNVLQHGSTLSFEVFEVDLTVRSCRQWRRLNSLEGQALFIGTYSKSVPAAECGLPQEDCIYFTCDYSRACTAPPNPLRDSGVFNMRNGMVTPLFLETMVLQRVVQGCPTWFFPSEVM